jgi:hypothetical protein
MVELIFGLLVFSILIFLILKAIGSLAKGLLFLFIAFLIYYFFSSSIQSLGLPLQTIGNFMKISIEKIKNTLFNLEIIAVTSRGENLLIVLRNNGIFPLTNFDVKVDGKETKFLNRIDILFPKQIGILEVEWKGNFSTVEIQTKEVKVTYYFSPLSQPINH